MKDVDFYGARHDMPLTLAGTGEENIIRKISGMQEVKTHLENLGFVVGGAVTVVSAIGGMRFESVLSRC